MENAKRILVIGLGNPPMLHTRHSIGLVILERIAKRLCIDWELKRRLGGHVAETSFGSKQLFLLKPKCLMNISGKNVIKAVNVLNICSNDIYLVHDDLDRPLGKVSLKLEGSAGGHNGVKSVISYLKTDKFKRFRFGIDRPDGNGNIVEYVLDKFSPDELPFLESAINNCVDTILRTIGSDYEIDELSVKKLHRRTRNQESCQM